MKWLLLGNLASTWTMVGVIWIVQVVHYPLFDRVGAEGFARYAHDHQRLITFVVLPTMLVELASAIGLLVRPPVGIPTWSLWLALALLGVIWLSTALLQVPQHERLGQGFDAAAYRFLVVSNWVRTLAWSLRGGLTLWWVGRLLMPPT